MPDFCPKPGCLCQEVKTSVIGGSFSKRMTSNKKIITGMVAMCIYIYTPFFAVTISAFGFQPLACFKQGTTRFFFFLRFVI